MKQEKHLVSPSAEWIHSTDPFLHIAQVARTCYKSEDKSDNDGSDFKLVRKLIENEHYAMLEHSHFSFLLNPVGDSAIPLTIPELLINIPGLAMDKCEEGWIVTVSVSHLFNQTWNAPLLEGLRDVICNEFRLWEYGIGCEEPEDGPLEYPMYIAGHRDQSPWIEVTRLIESAVKKYPFYPNHIFYTCKFICDRGVSHELVRHRASFAQESTRYCNYTSDEFNRSVTFVLPTTWSEWEESCKKMFLEHVTASEYIYNYMIYKGMEPQKARAVLPNSLKTEVVMTASIRQWRHFFDLRYLGNTGEPHPDMKHVAKLAHDSMPDDI